MYLFIELPVLWLQKHAQYKNNYLEHCIYNIYNQHQWLKVIVYSAQQAAASSSTYHNSLVPILQLHLNNNYIQKVF